MHVLNIFKDERAIGYNNTSTLCETKQFWQNFISFIREQKEYPAIIASTPEGRIIIRRIISTYLHNSHNAKIDFDLVCLSFAYEEDAIAFVLEWS